MKPVPQLSDEEIRSYMDFGSVIKQQKVIVAKRKVIRWTAGLVAVSVAVIMLVIHFNSLDVPVQSDRALPPEHVRERQPLKEDRVPLDPGTKIPEEKPENRNTSPGSVEGTTNEVEISPETKKGHPSETDRTKSGTVQGDVTEDIYVQAEPVDGYDALYAYFTENLHYPPDALNDTLQGAVVVVFVLNADGTPGNIEVKDRAGEAFTKEVVNLIEKMPAWKPATLNGKPVPSRITLPLTFRIERIKK